MKACEACGVETKNRGEFCPLCGEPLRNTQEAACPPDNAYPDLSGRVAGYNLMRRLLLFLSLLLCGLSVLVNLLVTPQFLWSGIVIAVTLYCWLSIPPLLQKGVNFAARCVFTVLFTGGLVIVLDFIIGYRGWSVDFVLPGLLIAGIAAIGMMMLLNRTNRTQYVLYQVLISVFGFLPLVLYLLDIAQNMVMVIVTAALAMGSLFATIVFGDRSIKSEFKRRFHF